MWLVYRLSLSDTHIERFAVFPHVAPGHAVMVPLETTMPEKATSCGGEKKTEIVPVKIPICFCTVSQIKE